MSLYNRYRPNSFEDLKGNEEIVEALTNMLQSKSCPHSFLLYGPSGCGKTTIGRIIASKLNCSGNDFKEINSADFNGIATIREIIKNSQYKPLESDCRIFLLDEVHQLSSEAQNGLLKQLEEPPSHVYYILCTTEPQKLLETVRNRCQRFEVHPISDVQMKGLLRFIVKAEGSTIDPDVMQQIIMDSQGSPRMAINILESVLNVSEDKRLAIAKKTAVEQSQVIELCRALVKGEKWFGIKKILVGLKDQEPEKIRRAVLGYCSSVLLNAENDRCAMIMEEMWEPFFNQGFSGLVYACYSITKN